MPLRRAPAEAVRRLLRLPRRPLDDPDSDTRRTGSSRSSIARNRIRSGSTAPCLPVSASPASARRSGGEGPAPTTTTPRALPSIDPPFSLMPSTSAMSASAPSRRPATPSLPAPSRTRATSASHHAPRTSLARFRRPGVGLAAPRVEHRRIAPDRRRSRGSPDHARQCRRWRRRVDSPRFARAPKYRHRTPPPPRSGSPPRAGRHRCRSPPRYRTPCSPPPHGPSRRSTRSGPATALVCPPTRRRRKPLDRRSGHRSRRRDLTISARFVTFSSSRLLASVPFLHPFSATPNPPHGGRFPSVGQRSNPASPAFRPPASRLGD